MKNCRAILLAFTLSLVFSAPAWPAPVTVSAPSALEAETAKSSAATAQASDAPDVRGTPDHALVVAIAEDKSKQSDDDIMALWTTRLGWATVGLVVVGLLQLVVIVCGGRDTRKAADAAVKSANAAAASVGASNVAAQAAVKSANVAERALTQLERPFVFGGVKNPGLEVYDSGGGGPRLKRDLMTISIYNHGRTPAILTEIHYDIRCIAAEDNPPVIDPDAVTGRKLPNGTLSVNKEPYEEQVNLKLQFVLEQADIAFEKKAVWIVGYVRYSDIFGRHHISGFASRFDPNMNRFVRIGDDSYNYLRDERETDRNDGLEDIT